MGAGGCGGVGGVWGVGGWGGVGGGGGGGGGGAGIGRSWCSNSGCWFWGFELRLQGRSRNINVLKRSKLQNALI